MQARGGTMIDISIKSELYVATNLVHRKFRFSE